MVRLREKEFGGHVCIPKQVERRNMVHTGRFLESPCLAWLAV